MAITSATYGNNISHKWLAITSAISLWQQHQPSIYQSTSGNNICHIGNKICHNNIVIVICQKQTFQNITKHSDNNICHFHFSNFGNTKHIIRKIFFLRHHQHQVSLQGKHFPIHLDEARSVGLAKACVILKIYSVPEKIK